MTREQDLARAHQYLCYLTAAVLPASVLPCVILDCVDNTWVQFGGELMSVSVSHGQMGIFILVFFGKKLDEVCDGRSCHVVGGWEYRTVFVHCS